MLNEADQSILKRDEQLPGLSLLLKPELLAQALATRLDSKLLRDLHIDYLRYKPGMNCVARIRLASGMAYAKIFATDAAAKMQKNLQLPDVPGPAGAGRICFESDQMIISFFPNDAKLRNLVRLGRDDERAALFARIFKDDSGWESADHTFLNYKPERRCVLKLQHESGKAATVKFYSRNEFRSARNYRKKFHPTPGLTIPDWIGGSKSYRVMAFDWIEGETLRNLAMLDVIEPYERTGAAVARFHQSHQPSLEKRSRKDQARNLPALSQQLSILLPEAEAAATGLATELANWWQGQQGVQTPIHGDFYDKQVIIQDTDIAIIDSDNARHGSPLEDLGCFIAHLERHAIDGLISSDRAEKITDHFLKGYRKANPDLSLKPLQNWTALCLFQLIHHPFRDRRADWPEQTLRLLARCQQLLIDKNHAN